MNKLPVYKTEGIILKAGDFGDLDRLLTIYTRGYGKIQARAISARKKGSKLNGLLQSFTYGKFLLAKSKTIDIITDLEVADSYYFLHSNLANLGYAFYFSELVDKLVMGQEKDDDLWRLIFRAFAVLNQKGSDLPKIKIAFEDKLVEFLGHGTARHANPVQRLNYLQSLAGERINSQKFLAQL